MSSPPRKMIKTDESAKKITPPDGVIRLELNNLSTTEGGVESPTVEVKGFPWCAEVRYYLDDDGCEELLVGRLSCMYRQPTPWAISVDVEYILVHSDSSKNITIERSYTYGSGNYEGRYVELQEWNDLFFDKKTRNEFNNDEGFVKDDKVTMEVRFWISCTRGFKTNVGFDFSDPNEPFHDITLVMNGEKIYASKQILASHSLVFKAMFYGDFVEKNMKEIELKDVDRQEFIELLNVIYPSCKSYKYLLKLGDRFQIMYVMNRVEEFLLPESLTIKEIEKLQLADQYRLSGLQARCLLNMTWYTHVESVKASPIYNDLSDEMKAALERRLVEIGGIYAD